MILTEDMIPPVYTATVITVHDGDTIDMNVNLGMGASQNARIRLEGIDAPEIMNTKLTSEVNKQGQIAKLIVKQWLYDYGPTFYLSASHKGIYGRWLGEVWRQIGEKSLNDYLIEKYYTNDGWYWYAQESLINDWFGSPEFHIWGKRSFIGFESPLINNRL